MISQTDAILALVVAVVTILGYIAWLVRKIRRAARAFALHQEEHRALLETAHWHEYGQVIPLVADSPGARHRRAHRARW